MLHPLSPWTILKLKTPNNRIIVIHCFYFLCVSFSLKMYFGGQRLANGASSTNRNRWEKQRKSKQTVSEKNKMEAMEKNKGNPIVLKKNAKETSMKDFNTTLMPLLFLQHLMINISNTFFHRWTWGPNSRIKAEPITVSDKQVTKKFLNKHCRPFTLKPKTYINKINESRFLLCCMWLL